MVRINVGINGLGRIGKCILLQLLENDNFNIKAINVSSLKTNSIQKYINNDATHGKHFFNVKVIDDDTIKINNQIIKIFHTRNAKEIHWKETNVEYLFETTGSYLTTDKANEHNADYIVMSAPPKDIDITPMYCYGVNEQDYKGEKVISVASCTTNCLAPFLKFCQDEKVLFGSFITVHAATASQSIVDVAYDNKRTNRSIFNNIIPHTTGASKTIDVLLPEIKGKIKGTSVRIPVSNVSMIDLNLTFENKVDIDKLFEKVNDYKYNDTLLLNQNNSVSCDFIGTEASCVIDKNSSFQMNDNNIKFTLWYDNEWSYSAQMIKTVKHMNFINDKKRLTQIYDVNFKNQQVLMRCDFNCPIDDENNITDYFRVDSAIKSIKTILEKGPKQLVILTHFGRPKNGDLKYSTKIFIPYLSRAINRDIIFLPNGMDTNLEELKEGVYLMENVRYHNYETKDENRPIIKTDVFVNEAFSVSHRDHCSITKIKSSQKCFGYCFVKEINYLNLVMNNNSNDKKLAIIGGSKMEDKIPMLQNLSKKVDAIFIAGNNINALADNPELLDNFSNNSARIILMNDGFGNIDPKDEPNYINDIKNKDNNKVFDIGPISLNILYKLIKETNIVFWNGTLGITENKFYKNGSESLIQMLNDSDCKVIIGGGDTSGFVNNYDNNFDHISTGGGASIEYISNGTLIGIN